MPAQDLTPQIQGSVRTRLGIAGLLALPTQRRRGDTELYSGLDRLTPEMFNRERADVFWFGDKWRAMPTRHSPEVAAPLGPKSQRTFNPVDPSWPLRRWLVWSVVCE